MLGVRVIDSLTSWGLYFSGEERRQTDDQKLMLRHTVWILAAQSAEK